MLLPRDDEKLAKRFGDLIYRLRESKSLSQRAAARLIGISQARLVSLEQGTHVSTGRPTLPPAELTVRIAAAYGYPREKLLLLAGHAPWLLDEAEASAVVDAVAERLGG